jgi:heat shock protein HslJ
MIGIACALAAGCENNNGDGTSGGPLAGTKWRLTAWSVSSSDSSQFTITADFDDFQVSGTSAVNLYGGPYTVTTDGGFSVGDLHATEMAGSDEAMRAEALYFDLLRQAKYYTETESTLTLKNEGNQDVLIFQAR